MIPKPVKEKFLMVTNTTGIPERCSRGIKNLGEDLLRYHYKDFRFVILDAETESLNLFYNKPWDWGLVVVEGGTVKSKESIYVDWPDLNISADAARITGFDRAEYDRRKKDSAEVFDKINSYLEDEDSIILTYNGFQFDNYLFSSHARELGKELNLDFIERSVDVLPIIRAFRSEAKPPSPYLKDKTEFLFWLYRWSHFYKRGNRASLGLIAADLDIHVDEKLRHTGIYDCLLTWEVFKAMLFKMEI